MKLLIKFLISRKQIETVAGIYISIVLAYLEEQNWREAKAIINILQEIILKPEEEQVLHYLQDIIQNHDEFERRRLFNYLSA